MKFGVLIAQPTVTRMGYTFDGWEPELSTAALMPDADCTYKAKWTENTDTPYIVEHYEENLNGTWPTTPRTESRKGTTNEELTGEKHKQSETDYPGFTWDSKDVRNVANVALAGDGSTVLKLYYKRNTYLLEFDTNGDGQADITLKVKYGALINQQLLTVSKAIEQAEDGAEQVTVQTPIQDNKIFNGWEITEKATGRIITKASAAGETTMDVTANRNISCKALWGGVNDPRYEMRYYTPKASDPKQYDLQGVETRTTTTPTTITVVPRAFDGYVVDTYNVDGKDQTGGEITTKQGETVVVKIYYKAADYTVTLNGDPGIDSVTGGGSYTKGQAVTATAVVNENYTFAGWESANTLVPGSADAAYTFDMPKGNVILTAKATPKTYAIKYSVGTVDYDDGALLKAYTYGKETKLPLAFSRDGRQTASAWTIVSTNETIRTISATQSGDITLKPVWTKVVEVTFDAGENGLIGSERTVSYAGFEGATLDAPNATRDGYLLEGWFDAQNKQYGGVLPENDTTYVAKWSEDQGGGSGGGTPVPQKIPVTSAKLEVSSVEVKAGKTVAIRVILEPANANDYTVTYVSGDPTKATVSAGGIITGVAEGETTVTVTIVSGDNTFTLPCAVKVSAAEGPGPDDPDPDDPDGPAPIITVIDTLCVGSKGSTVLPVYEGAVVTWRSDDETIAKLNKTGKKIVPVKVGETTLTMTVISAQTAKGLKLDGSSLKAGEEYKIKLCVRKPAELAKHVTLNRKNVTLNLKENKTFKLIAKVTPTAKVRDKTVFWASRNPAVAKVDKDGNITAVAPGKTEIYAYSTNLKWAKVSVTVGGLVTKIRFVNDAGKVIKKASVKVGAKLPLKLRFNNDALNTAVTWKVGKSGAIVTVDENGVLTGVKKGSAKVTATATDGSGKKATIIITVKK